METIESINGHLIEHFGIDTSSGQPMFRVVWSDDQYEKRKTNVSGAGIQLLNPMVLELPKYKQWITERWVLERLVGIPDIHKDELVVKQSYEPLWVFRGKNGEFLPPKWEVCKFVIDTLYAALGKSSMAKYVDEEAKNPDEARKVRLAILQEQLFGDESGLENKTLTGEAVVVPHNYKKGN